MYCIDPEAWSAVRFARTVNDLCINYGGTVTLGICSRNKLPIASLCKRVSHLDGFGADIILDDMSSASRSAFITAAQARKLQTIDEGLLIHLTPQSLERSIYEANTIDN